MEGKVEYEEYIIEVTAALQNYQFGLPLQVYSFQQLQEHLALYFNYLITNNFSLLISILYRVDISEKKLKQLLSLSKNSTAGDIIAKLVIERQLQKLETRRSFQVSSANIPENEKW